MLFKFSELLNFAIYKEKNTSEKIKTILQICISDLKLRVRDSRKMKWIFRPSLK